MSKKYKSDELPLGVLRVTGVFSEGAAASSEKDKVLKIHLKNREVTISPAGPNGRFVEIPRAEGVPLRIELSTVVEEDYFEGTIHSAALQFEVFGETLTQDEEGGLRAPCGDYLAPQQVEDLCVSLLRQLAKVNEVEYLIDEDVSTMREMGEEG